MTEKYVARRPAYLDLANWNPADHPRDHKGRFTTKVVSLPSAVSFFDRSLEAPHGFPDTGGRYKPKSKGGVVDMGGTVSTKDRGDRLMAEAHAARRELYEQQGLVLKRPEVTDEQLLDQWESAGAEDRPALEEEIKRRMEILSRTSAAIDAEYKRQQRQKKRDEANRNDEILDVVPGGGVIKKLRDKLLLSDAMLDRRERLVGFVKENALGYGISVGTATAIAMIFSPMLGGVTIGVLAGTNLSSVLNWAPVATALDVLAGHWGVKAVSKFAKSGAGKVAAAKFHLRTPEV